LLHAVMLVVFVGPAWAQGSAILRAKAADVDALLARSAGPDGVRVIVTLAGATAGAPTAPPDSSTQAPSTPDPSAAPGAPPPGTIATVEQAQVLATHVGSDDTRRRRRAPRLIPGTPYMAMTVTTAELEALAADPGVIRIHEDGLLRPGLQDSVPLIGMAAAYARGGAGANTIVAVLDTGVEYGHVFTTPRVTEATCFSTTNASFTTFCPNGMDTQFGGAAGVNCGVSGCFHGTHVAGIAAGSRASGTPLNGVARSAEIFAGQVFARRNTDNALIAFDSDILASLNDLLNRVNTSCFGSRRLAAINVSIWDSGFQVSGNCDASARGVPFRNVIDSLRSANVATVIISGNASQTNLSAFPGCVSSAVTVGSTTKADVVSSFSNMSAIVDLLAPGSDITSSVNPTPSFGSAGGTSMAAPHVAGAFAAIRSACPGATVSDIEAILKNTGTQITDTRAGGTHVKPRIRVGLAVQTCASRPRDVDGNGASDLVWRNSSSGQVSVWLMNGSSVAAAGGLPAVGGTWAIVGIGDFNADGRADLLWRDGAGNVAIWLLNGLAPPSTAVLGNVSTAYTVAGIGDVNADGRADIVWRHSSGQVFVWLMNGSAISGSGNLGTVAAAWTIRRIADFNGDGRADILWRHTSGDVAIWLLNGLAAPSNAVLGNVPTVWAIAGTGDVDFDGKADIVWRHTGNGSVAVWLMNGLSVGATGGFGVVSLTWTIDKIGDFNNDGRADLLWRDGSGNLAMWLLNGLAPPSTAVLGNVSPSWVTQVAGAP
jgi:hypothetical protein